MTKSCTQTGYRGALSIARRWALGLGLAFASTLVQAENLAVQAGWLFDSESGRLLEKRTDMSLESAVAGDPSVVAPIKNSAIRFALEEA